MKKTSKRNNQNATTPRKNGMAKDVETTIESTQRKSKENEKAEMRKTSGENDQVENFNYIKSYLSEIFELAKSDDSVTSKRDGNVKSTHNKSSEFGETISRLQTKNNSLNVEWDLDNTYEFETMESGSYPNGAVQLVGEAANVGEASAGASLRGGNCAHALRLKKALTSGDEREYNIFGSKSLFNHFGSFNRNGNPGVWLMKNEEIYNAPKGKSVQNGVSMKMAEGRGEHLIDDVVRGVCPMEPSGNFDTLEGGGDDNADDAFPMSGSSLEQERYSTNVELLLAQLGGSNGHIGGLETLQTGKPQELNKNLFQVLSGSNREFLCNYIRKYREMGECEEEAVIEGAHVEGEDMEERVQGEDALPFDGYEKGKSVCFDLPTLENSLILSHHTIETYVKSDRGNEAGIGFKWESSRSSGENLRPSGEEIVKTERVGTSGDSVNEENGVKVKHDLRGMMDHRDDTNAGEYKREGYEYTDSNAPNGQDVPNAPSLFFIPEWVGTDQGETCMQGKGLDKGDREGKRSATTPPSHVAPPDEWDEKTPSVGPNTKECTTSELYINLLQLLNDESHNVKVENTNDEIVMHTGKSLFSGETHAYYQGDILRHVAQEEGGRHSHLDDQHTGGNDPFAHRANYESVRNYANGLSGVDDGAKMSQVERGVTMGDITSAALPVKNYFKYPTTPFPILHDNAPGSFRNGGQSTHGSPHPIAKKKNVMFEALKNKIGFLLDNEDDEVLLSQYIMDSIGDYNRSKWGRGASGRESMQVGRPSVGERAGLVFNRVEGASEIATGTELQIGYAKERTQNGILKSETINYNWNGAAEQLREVDLRGQNHHTSNLLLGRGQTDTYNYRYSQMDRVRGGSPPEGAELAAIREDKWRADKFNDGTPHVRNRTERSSIANLKLFLANSLVANNISNSRAVAVEAGIPSGQISKHISKHISDYTSGQRNSLGRGTPGGDSAFGQNGDDTEAGWNAGPVSPASPVLPSSPTHISSSDVPVKALEGRNSANVGSFPWGDYSIERGDAIRGSLRTANKEEDNEEQLRKINENLLLLSRRNSRSLRRSDVSRVEEGESAAKDASPNGYVVPLHGMNSLMRIPQSAHRDGSLATKGGNSFLKRDSANLKIHQPYGGGVGSDTLSGVVGSFEKGHFIDEVGSNWSRWNFKGRERDIEEAKREGILFGGRREDLSFSSRGKGAFEDSRNNSLWNRNVVSGSSITRGSYSGRNNHSSSSNGRLDRLKSQERRGMSNTRGKKKSIEARHQLSAQALKACLSKEDEQDLEDLLNSLYDDRIIPLIINLKGRADEYNFRDLIKNNIRNAYGLFPEKYTVKENYSSSSSSPSPSSTSSSDNYLVHFAHRKVDDDYFFSINDSVDRYDPSVWNQFEKYLLEIATSDDPQMYSFTGGRYGMAKELQRRKLPFFQGLYLGQLCHIVHISATRKIIAYENNFIKPISQCRKYEDAKMGILNPRGGDAKNYIASMEELKFYLTAILKSHKRGINISTLKVKMMNIYNKRLCESIFHCVKLVELLQMEELRDVCVVDMESRVLRAVVAR
ncbi:hypothetical protein C922_03653 [Plasmodium inui San Antonio 1]|uniref:HTH OST-type domain-containing protein n=1 Tax=Plasmodium inui San Antonio 1 TaxID=1237626 RepID=W7A9V0_9APIC|nr:hypothetical protein C922_03653 [Plasmodium inui San Antonio 1]EUD65929.1 hypothetical protein C922_03653 [Plasmodium inui San Antonio 1]